MDFEPDSGDLWPNSLLHSHHSLSLDYSFPRTDSDDLYTVPEDHTGVNSNQTDPIDPNYTLQQIQKQKQEIYSKIQELDFKIQANENYQNYINYVLSEIRSIHNSQLESLKEPKSASRKRLKKSDVVIEFDKAGFSYPITSKDTNFVYHNQICQVLSNMIKNNFMNYNTKSDLRYPIVWSSNDEKKLYKCIQNEIYTYYQELLLKYQEKFSTSSSEVRDPSLDINIEKIKMKKDIESIELEDINEYMNQISWETIGNQLNRLPSDCLCRWLNICDPNINKSKWTFEEEKKLYELVHQFEEHDWISIAYELGTKRTPFMCLEHYQQCYNTSLVNTKWSESEDQQLQKIVEEYGHKNWSKVASLIPNRSASQCRSRYHQVLKKTRRIGRWSNLEDMSLILAKYYTENSLNVQNYQTSWKLISSFMSSRNATQCRERWENILKPTISCHQWTVEEDKKLLELAKDFHSMGSTHWARIAEEFNGRTDTQCRRRFKYLKNITMKQIKKQKRKNHHL